MFALALYFALSPFSILLGVFAVGAIIKYGHLIAEARGKLNGTVFSRNTYGAYMRTKVTPTNPSTPSQSAVRARFADASQAWRGLGIATLTAWRAIAVQFTRTNVFGDNVPLTGFNLWVRLNRNLQEIGLALLTSPPAPTTVEGVTGLTITPNATAGTFLIAFTPTPTPADHYMIVQATPGVSAGIKFLGGQYRTIGVLPPASASTVNIFADYTDKFGDMTVGLTYGVRVKFVEGNTGIPSTPFEAIAVAV